LATVADILQNYTPFDAWITNALKTLMSEISEEITSVKSWNGRFRQHHGHSAPLSRGLQRIFAYTVYYQKLDRRWLHASVFTFCGGLRNHMHIETGVVQAYPRSLIWYESKQRIRLPISHQLYTLPSYLASFQSYCRFFSSENDPTPIPPVGPNSRRRD